MSRNAKVHGKNVSSKGNECQWNSQAWREMTIVNLEIYSDQRPKKSILLIVYSP